MNIILVSPYRGAIFESSGVTMQPLGISYVGAALRQAGHEVQIEILEDPESKINFEDADVVGISCLTIQFKPGIKVARAAKESGKTVVMGGIHVTSRPEDALNSGYVDYVVRGEGETTAVELLEGLKDPRHFDPARVAGLSWKEDGVIRHSEPRPFIQELDTIPFPLREGSWRKSGRIQSQNDIDYPVITTRGCPYGCKFCDVNVIAGKKFRRRSIRNIIDEVEYLVNEYGKEDILFLDDIINFNAKRLTELCDALIERHLPVMSWVMGRADHLLQNPETAEKMQKAGVRLMFMGIESPEKRILKAYRKGGKASSEVSINAVKLLKDEGIETWGAYMMGEPAETREDIRATIDYAKFLNTGVAQFSILTPFPSTELWQEYSERIFTSDWDKYDCMHSVFRGDKIESAELEKLCRKAYVKYYTQPKRIAKELFSKHHYGRPSLKMVRQVVKAVRAMAGTPAGQQTPEQITTS